MRIASPGHAVFVAILLALGVFGLVYGAFAPIWSPVDKDLPGREVLAYACALILVITGIGLVVRRFAALAARVLLAYLALWIVAFRVRGIVRAPREFGSWDGCAETIVIAAAAWVLHAWFADDWDRRHVGFTTGERGVRIARGLYGIAMIPFALAHFIYVQETAVLVPDWLPAHVAIAYFTGAAFLAAGAAVLTGIYAQLAAALSAVQIGLFTVLVWVPMIAKGSANTFQWSELAISVALTAAAWVVADSYRVKMR